MAILMFEGFRTYPTAADMFSTNGLNGPYTIFRGGHSPGLNLLQERPTWKGDGSLLRAFATVSNFDSSAPQRDFTGGPAVKSVCAQFICGGSTAGTNTESVNFCLFQEPVVPPEATGNLSSFYGVSIYPSGSSIVGDGSRPAVYYTIPTNTNGSVSRVLLGYLRPWKDRTHYHVEMKVDHTNPVARIIIYVNGVLEMDATYDRDRIDNGLQTKDFKRVLLGGNYNATPANATAYSNVVIYTDEAGTAFPLGPIDVETLSPTTGQGYDGLVAAPNADDSTYSTILPGGALAGTFQDLALNPNPVLAVDAIIRHGSVAGIEPSQITTRLRKSDGTVLASMLTTAAPGLPPTHCRARLPAGTTAADVNGMVFEIQAAV